MSDLRRSLRSTAINHPGWRRLRERAIKQAVLDDGSPVFSVARVGTGLCPWAWHAVEAVSDPLDEHPPIVVERQGRARNRRAALAAATRALSDRESSFESVAAYGGVWRARAGAALAVVALVGALLMLVGIVGLARSLAFQDGAWGTDWTAFALGVTVALAAMLADEKLRARGDDR